MTKLAEKIFITIVLVGITIPALTVLGIGALLALGY